MYSHLRSRIGNIGSVLRNDAFLDRKIMDITINSVGEIFNISFEYQSEFNGYILLLEYNGVSCIINIMSGLLYLKETSDPALEYLNFAIPSVLVTYYENNKEELKMIATGNATINRLNSSNIFRMN